MHELANEGGAVHADCVTRVSSCYFPEEVPIRSTVHRVLFLVLGGQGTGIRLDSKPERPILL